MDWLTLSEACGWSLNETVHAEQIKLDKVIQLRKLETCHCCYDAPIISSHTTSHKSYIVVSSRLIMDIKKQ